MKRLIVIIALCSSFFPLFANDPWVDFKNDTVKEMVKIPGWCTKEKAGVIMDLIKENKFKTCVEIGVFAGMSLFPIAKALQYNKEGLVYGIDAWDCNLAIKGHKKDSAHSTWWKTVDYESAYKTALGIANQEALSPFCQIIHLSSESALEKFSDESIDFIHFSGNPNEDLYFQDVTSYFSKVKDGGYILVNNPYHIKGSIIFLLEKADLMSSFSLSSSYILFRKNNERIQNSNFLFKEKTS